MSLPTRNAPLDRLNAGADAFRGLSQQEVIARRAQFGANQILEHAPSGWSEVMRDSARDPMLWFLLLTAALFGLLGQWNESLVLLVALLPLLCMDAYLHWRTHASTRELGSRLAATANVERDGTRQTVAASELVPGDLVLMQTGDTVPADGLLLQVSAVQVDESVLTGEAMPVAKTVAGYPPAGLSQWPVSRSAWAFAGTRMLTGEASMQVVFTGPNSLYGEIASSAISGSHLRSPLQLAVDHLVKVLIAAALVLCAILAWVRLEQGHGLVDALLSALTLAIAAFPEEFPVVLTFFLGVGVYRLAKRRALVRRAVVVENIGRVSCICSDKTGTITEGRLRLAKLSAAEHLSDQQLLQLAAMASRLESGDPLDAAILAAYQGEPTWQIEHTFPFTEDRRRETGVISKDGKLLAVTKGSPEVILALCELDAAQAASWLERVQTQAARGLKVIACASRPLDATGWAGGEPDRGFALAGLLCFADPVRAGVAQALQTCAKAGIRVIMVTGDHAGTASAIARQLGLGGSEPRVVDAQQLGTELERGNPDFLRDLDVVCRAMPSQKLALVRALQAQGEIVAVTGDGINDVPALQAADIGIAMGQRGTRSAREVAPIVLLDDDFASIVGAIAEGRQLFANLQMSFQYLLMIHLPLVITAALLPLLGYPVLYLPVHIVWLELIIHPTALLVFQGLPQEGRFVRKQDKRARPRFFDDWQWAAILGVGALITTVVGLAFVRGLEAGGGVDHARAIALGSLSSASAGIIAGLTGLRHRAAQMMFAATLILSFALIEIPMLAGLLHLTPLDPDDLLIIVGGAAVAALLASLPRWRAQ